MVPAATMRGRRLRRIRASVGAAGTGSGGRGAGRRIDGAGAPADGAEPGRTGWSGVEDAGGGPRSGERGECGGLRAGAGRRRRRGRPPAVGRRCGPLARSTSVGRPRPRPPQPVGRAAARSAGVRSAARPGGPGPSEDAGAVEPGARPVPALGQPHHLAAVGGDTSPAPTPPKQTSDDHRVQAPGALAAGHVSPVSPSPAAAPSTQASPSQSKARSTSARPQRVAGRHPHVDPDRVVRESPAPLPRPTGGGPPRSRRRGRLRSTTVVGLGRAEHHGRCRSAGTRPPPAASGRRPTAGHDRVQRRRRRHPLLDPPLTRSSRQSASHRRPPIGRAPGVLRR